MAADPPREGILVIRAWVEDHPAAALRAVVIEVGDPTGTQPAKTTASAAVDDVCGLVREWLIRLLG